MARIEIQWCPTHWLNKIYSITHWFHNWIIKSDGISMPNTSLNENTCVTFFSNSQKLPNFFSQMHCSISPSTYWRLPERNPRLTSRRAPPLNESNKAPLPDSAKKPHPLQSSGTLTFPTGAQFVYAAPPLCSVLSKILLNSLIRIIRLRSGRNLSRRVSMELWRMKN